MKDQATEPRAPLSPPVLQLAREVADEAASGVLLLDAGGFVRWTNPAEAQAWGSATPPVGRDFFRDLAPNLEGEGVGPAYRAEAADDGFRVELETVLGSSHGSRFVRLVIRTLPWEGGAWGMVLVEDRTALIAERERRKNAERMAALGEMAAGLAHEVNNPLASIRSFAQLLEREAEGEVQRRALGLIVADCDRITASMDALVSLVRRHGPEVRGAVDLNGVARRILEMQRYALSTGGIEVRPDLQEPLSRVHGEAGALQQLVLELVLNAERSLARRDGERLLVVRTRESSQGVTLAVFDNGPGVARERLGRLFEATGEGRLGLSVAAGIARDHGGSVRAESEEGRNTTIIVELPREGDTAVRRPAPAAAVPGTSSSPPRSLRVLVADDESSLRSAIRMFLERRGHRVVDVPDAHQAWVAAQREPFDVALVDARMPGDGVRLLEQLETLPGLAGRTALMTGDLGRTRTEQDVSTERPCLAKPFELNEMVRLLEALGG